MDKSDRSARHKVKAYAGGVSDVVTLCHAGDRGSIPRRGEHIFASQASLAILISMQKHLVVELGYAVSLEVYAVCECML